MACRAGLLTRGSGMCFQGGRVRTVAVGTQSVQPKLPWSPGSPTGDAFGDCGPKVVQQKAYSALV